MDITWASEKLNAWIELALQARHTELGEDGRARIYGWSYSSEPKVRELRRNHDQVARIVSQALKLRTAPDLLASGGSTTTVDLMGGISLCEEAFGRLLTEVETQEKLGAEKPPMDASQLHRDIWEAASRRWDSGNYSDAVQRAATFMNASIQDASGRRDVSDSELMREVFSLAPPTAGRPRIMWPGVDSDLGVRTMRVGILNYAQGIFSAIRNTATHSIEELSPQVALEQLAALSLLARWVEECVVVTIDG